MLTVLRENSAVGQITGNDHIVNYQKDFLY